jgi:hypothetical protein
MDKKDVLKLMQLIAKGVDSNEDKISSINYTEIIKALSIAIATLLTPNTRTHRTLLNSACDVEH